MHNRALPSVSIDSLEKPGDKTLIACWPGQRALLSICKNGLSSSMESGGGGGLLPAPGCPSGGIIQPGEVHLSTNKQLHQVSTEAETCIGGQPVYIVNAAPPVALQALRHGLGAQFKQKSSGRWTLQSTGTSWAGPCAVLLCHGAHRAGGYTGRWSRTAVKVQVDSWVWMTKTWRKC